MGLDGVTFHNTGSAIEGLRGGPLRFEVVPEEGHRP